MANLEEIGRNTDARIETKLFESFRKYKEKTDPEHRTLSPLIINPYNALYLQGVINYEEQQKIEFHITSKTNDYYVELAESIFIERSSVRVIKTDDQLGFLAHYQPKYSMYFFETVVLEMIPKNRTDHKLLSTLFNVVWKLPYSGQFDEGYMYEDQLEVLKEENAEDDNEWTESVQNMLNSLNLTSISLFKVFDGIIKLRNDLSCYNIKDKQIKNLVKEIVILLKNIDNDLLQEYNEMDCEISNISSCYTRQTASFIFDSKDMQPYIDDRSNYYDDDVNCVNPLVPLFFKEENFDFKYADFIRSVYEIFDKVIDIQYLLYKKYEEPYYKKCRIRKGIYRSEIDADSVCIK